MGWIIVVLMALGLVCCLPDIRFYLGLVWQAVRESRRGSKQSGSGEEPADR